MIAKQEQLEKKVQDLKKAQLRETILKHEKAELIK